MKKVLAIILTVVMLFGVVAISTSADEVTPTVKIITNEGSPVAKGVTTYFTVKFENFSAIKGMDVTITADEYIALGAVTVTGFDGLKADENVNYTEENEGDEHTIRFVDLTAGKDGKITFEATVPDSATPAQDPTIKVSGKYADSGKSLFEVDAPVDGTFELTKAIDTSAPIEDVEKDAEIPVEIGTKKFVPQGAVYYKDGDNYVFAKKDENGKFIADKGAGDYVYHSYDVPANGLTTFGASNDPEDDTRLRFGSYSTINSDAKENGTLIFEGEWLELKNYYIKNGYTVQQFVKALYTDVTAKLAANPNATHVYYKVNGKTINVYRFVQKKYMWKDTESGILEYAIRLDGIKSKTTYTGVAYSIAGDNAVTLSEDVKSVTTK